MLVVRAVVAHIAGILDALAASAGLAGANVLPALEGGLVLVAGGVTSSTVLGA